MCKKRLAVMLIMTISWVLAFTACDDGSKPSPPSVPTGVSATATSSSSITVSWNAISNADGYFVYRSLSSSGTYTRVGTPSTALYTDNGLSGGTTYYYKVSANNSAGEGSQSLVVSATTSVLTYAVTVINGTGGGNYVQGATITITANTPLIGQQFTNWTTESAGVTFANTNSAITTFTMPGNAVTVTANYSGEGGTTYTVTVTNGTGGGNYAQGATVTITANTPSTGQRFSNWTTESAGVTFANANEANTTFTMPGNAVTVTANITATSTPTYAIGSTGPGGGIIFYYNAAGFTVKMENPAENYTAHYLEVAPAITGTYQWDDNRTPISGVTTLTTVPVSITANNNDTIGNGRKDTALIAAYLASTAQTNMAAQICTALTTGGKNDWFLPSVGELSELYKRRTLTGINITSGSYWSSTQAYNNDSVWWLRFYPSQTHDMYDWNTSGRRVRCSVRAIRAFSAGLNPTVTYNVMYNINNGMGTTPAAQTVNAGSSVTLPGGSGFSRTNYTFVGWNTNADGTGTDYAAGSSYMVTGNITLYAKWIVAGTTTYKVSFNINGGIGTTLSDQIVNSGSSITLPSGSGLTRNGYTFGGWNTSNDGTGTNYAVGASYTPAGNITLYAKWDIIPLNSVTGLANKLNWLATHAVSGDSYILEIEANESISPQNLSYSDRNNITITLIGIGTNRTVSLTSNGAMFTVGNGITLILDNNITLQGRSNNNNALVSVNYGGMLKMNTGSVITGNTNTYTSSVEIFSYSYGGGVNVGSGTFTMSGGEISGNTSSSNYSYSLGGGVYVGSGTFTMSGGEISGNTSTNSAAASTYSLGGGVYVGSGTFIMNGGEISGNTSISAAATTAASTNYCFGGGVYVDNGTFTKTNGTIYGYNAGDTVNSNTVKNSSGTVRDLVGHAVCAVCTKRHNDGTSTRVRNGKETTAGPGENLSFNGTVYPPIFSGNWDY